MRNLLFLALGTMVRVVAPAAEPDVALIAQTHRQFYHENARNEVYLEAKIVTSETPPAHRSPRNIALVLDRSGSMAGEPLQALRTALAAAWGALEAHDIVSVVAFGSEVETLLEAQPRAQAADMTEWIARLEPAGGAALYDALNQGAAQLRRNAGPTTFNHLVLVTDGPPTKGPRELDDFARLADVFAREGLMVSALGLGEECHEDLLATLARSSQGQFRFVRDPAQLRAALEAELTLSPVVIGRDAVLTIEFLRSTRQVQSHSWPPSTTDRTTLTFHLPQLFAGRKVGVLVSAENDPFIARFDVNDFAAVRLRWKSAFDGAARETTQKVPLRFTADTTAIRESLDREVAPMIVTAVIRAGLQKAIEQIDRGDPRRALRTLRSARSDAKAVNFDLDIPLIDEQVRRLDAYLTEAQPRGLGTLDRKILRSGLLNQFDPPAPNAEPKD